MYGKETISFVNKELKDIYNALAYIIDNDVNRSEKWLKYDLSLFWKVRMYIVGYASEYDVSYVDNFIKNHNIIFLLRKIIGINNSKYLEEYLSICSNDLSEIVYPNMEDEFNYLDSFDLYLYYFVQYSKIKHSNNNKERKRFLK